MDPLFLCSDLSPMQVSYFLAATPTVGTTNAAGGTQIHYSPWHGLAFPGMVLYAGGSLSSPLLTASLRWQSQVG